MTETNPPNVPVAERRQLIDLIRARRHELDESWQIADAILEAGYRLAGAVPDTGQAREPATLVDLRARIAAAFAAVDNFAGESPTREQLDWAHIAACVVLNIGQAEPSGDTGPLRAGGRRFCEGDCSCGHDHERHGPEVPGCIECSCRITPGCPDA